MSIFTDNTNASEGSGSTWQRTGKAAGVDRTAADSGEVLAVAPKYRRLPHAYLGPAALKAGIEVDRHTPRETGRPVPYRSALRRDARAPASPDGNATWAAFLGLCATAVCSWALCKFDDTGCICAALGVGALPGGLVAVSVMGSFRSTVRAGFAGFALVSLPAGFFLVCVASIYGLLLTAIWLALAMFWFTIGALLGAPLARRDARTLRALRARRWPYVVQHTRRMP